MYYTSPTSTMHLFPRLTQSTVFFDGMTIQQVGEVIADAACTGAIRSRCFSSYIRALEEFAYAVVFADRFGTNPQLPPVGTETPGQALIEDSVIRRAHLFEPLPRTLQNPDLQDLLREPAFFNAVSRDISNFPCDISGLFDEWLIREVCAYPLEHYEQRESEVRFGSRVYMRHPALEVHIPSNVLSSLVAVVRHQCRRPASDDLARAFVSVNIVNLAGISRMYEWGVAALGSGDKYFRIPHQTRARLLLNNSGNYERNRLLGALKKCTLACVVREISLRQDFLERLVTFRSGVGPLAQIRSLLETLALETDDRAIGVLNQMIFDSLPHIPETIIGVSAEQLTTITQHRNLLHFVGSRVTDNTEYIKNIFTVFPSLDPTRAAPVYVPGFTQTLDDSETPTPTRSCFISYSASDAPFVKHLAKALTMGGVSYFAYEEHMQAGEHILTTIDSQLKACEVVLVCCSKSSLASTNTWVTREVGLALQKEENLTRISGKAAYTLIPLNLDNYLFRNDVPLTAVMGILRGRAAVDFHGATDAEGAFERTLTELVNVVHTRLSTIEQKQR